MEKIDPLLIVWDLDETLIHCDDLGMIDRNDPDFIWEEEEYRYFIRPGAKELISLLESDSRFLQGIFTASSEDYAEFVSSQLWPSDASPEFILSSSSITRSQDTEGHHTGEFLPKKDLKKITRKGYSKERIIAVDDKPELYSRHFGNVLSIPAYKAEREDTALYHLKSYLYILEAHPSMRKIEKRGWLQRMRRCDKSTLSLEP